MPLNIPILRVLPALLTSILQKSYDTALEPFKWSHMNTDFFWFGGSSGIKRIGERVWFWKIQPQNFFWAKNQSKWFICLKNQCFSWNWMFYFTQGLSVNRVFSIIFSFQAVVVFQWKYLFPEATPKVCIQKDLNDVASLKQRILLKKSNSLHNISSSYRLKLWDMSLNSCFLTLQD